MLQKSVVFLRSNPVDPDPRVEKEANCLAKAGYKVAIAAWDRSTKHKVRADFLDLENGTVLVYRFGIPSTYGGGKKSLGAFLKFQAHLFFWLCKNRNMYQTIHACDFDTAFTALYAAKILEKKLIFDIFDFLYSDVTGHHKAFKRFIVKCEHRIINYADGVIICTEKRKQQIQGTSPKRLVIVHNSPKDSEVLPTFDLDKGKTKIAYVGILQDTRFLKELAEVIKQKPNCELHIGGFGKYDKYFESLAAENNKIIYYGKLPYARTLELEMSCDIMTAIYDPIIGNHYYAAPNKFYEALMLGKPLIMVKNTGMDNVVSENDIGKVIEYNIEDLSYAIDWLIGRKNEWNTMSETMKYLYHNMFSWTEMETRLLSLYSEITRY